jgi:RNA polymerase subunit RPABC4/transcription elongation factor Spt4
MALHQDVKNYSNIQTSLRNNVVLNSSMICKKELLGSKKSGEAVYNLQLNTEFWKGIKEPINVILDEAHSIVNSRRAMSKVNIVVTDWISLIRRVLGEDSRGMGDLVLITQLPNRIDSICRDMANQVRYHNCHYVKSCNNCNSSWNEDTDMPELARFCPNCGSIDMRRSNFQIEVMVYPGMQSYTAHKIYGMATHYRHYFVRDIEKYFPLYNSLQWDNLFSDVYY